MQPVCPQCHQPVEAEQINIQQMVALCLACDSVFELRTGLQRRKARKTQRPPGLQLHDDDPLIFKFRTNFRLEKNENFVNSAVLSLVFSLLTTLMVGLSLEGEAPIFLAMLFAILAVGAFYWLASIVWNATEIAAADSSLMVSRRPLPVPASKRVLDLSSVDAIYAEETAASRQDSYDTPRFHVWASETVGRRKLVVADLTEDYATYIASRLDAWLRADDDRSADRLSLDEADDDAAELAARQAAAADDNQATVP
ncbi:MAG: hypothetical protein OXE95_12715 [Chloroflexi bacterium]|nr:hypothetical protein [Chloroflexota bacterium]MCY4248424.1 hypothetical protein [Chloroflexota bacterium]